MEPDGLVLFLFTFYHFVLGLELVRDVFGGSWWVLIFVLKLSFLFVSNEELSQSNRARVPFLCTKAHSQTPTKLCVERERKASDPLFALTIIRFIATIDDR